MSMAGPVTRPAGVTNWPLAELLAGFAVLPFESGPRVTELALDSRRVMPGCLFLACRGRGTHGLAHAEEAAERGCVAIAAEPDADWGEAELGRLAVELSLPVIPVPNLGKRAADIAARFFGHPAKGLEVFGVTGTSGKTCVTHYLAGALAAAVPQPALRCAVIGSLGHGFPHDGLAAGDDLSTPDPVSLQRQLATLRAQGAEAVALEASSHALDQRRIGAVWLSHAVFTNLSRDHLDYHGDMASYAAAMRRLFRTPVLRWAVLNADDPASAGMAAALEPGVSVARYGQGATPPDSDSDLWIWAPVVTPVADGLQVQVQTSIGAGSFTAPVIGRSQVANLLAVLAVLLSRGEALPTALARLGTLRSLPGRMERFGGGGRPLVVVDNAHAPAALEQALTELRRHCRGRLLLVFGCGGGRDAGKRPAMGAVAERLADVVIVTEDNPRFEDAERINAQILAGMARPQAAIVEHQRALAIRAALARAGRDDAVLVAGKGSETVQDMGELKVQFSDRAQVVQALGEWEGRRS
ncbi:Mur ligase family protein [uncultured Thiohalocapsa sp.]|uniref:Mur ligase family protein n=1 Tax=uncultured Thiohalocapsa sp. TaxID=768990 RepID=UPI0025CE4606|nr:UDP-N-acetylmuramoyl-L-alanyl-D-glutamate--2,6-diaminopimelate ligase [uncultured Thiohalocapsa sp.]